jgi:octaprenyl-diphosphate synthase
MKHGSAEQSACVRHAIEEGGRESLPGVLGAIRATGALDETRRHAEAEARLALEAVAPLPASPFKDSLVQLASFAVARDF